METAEVGEGSQPGWCHFKVTVGQETPEADKCQGVRSPSLPPDSDLPPGRRQLGTGASSSGHYLEAGGIPSLLIGHDPPRIRRGSW